MKGVAFSLIFMLLWAVATVGLMSLGLVFVLALILGFVLAVLILWIGDAADVLDFF